MKNTLDKVGSKITRGFTVNLAMLAQRRIFPAPARNDLSN
jgi:hypothetical protein